VTFARAFAWNVRCTREPAFVSGLLGPPRFSKGFVCIVAFAVGGMGGNGFLERVLGFLEKKNR